MSDLRYKLTHIYLPYVYTWLGVIVGYTLLNYALIVKAQWGNLSEIAIEIVFPALIVIITLALVMNKRVQRLNYYSPNGSFGLLLLMGVGLVIPLSIAQKYMAKATGELTVLQTIAEINQHPKTKYYMVKKGYYYKKAAGVYRRVYADGKHKKDLHFNLFCATPILPSPGDTLKKSTHYWWCTKYHKSISNGKPEFEKRKALKRFLNQSYTAYQQENPKAFTFFERINHTIDTDKYAVAAGYSIVNRDGADVFLIGHKTAFESRCGNLLLWFWITAAISHLLLMLMVYLPKLKSKTALQRNERQQKANWFQYNTEEYRWLVPRKGFYTTLLLVYANGVVYLLMVANGSPFGSFPEVTLVDWGSLFKPDTLNGQWWRLLTYQFVNNGFKALLFNMSCLIFVGLCLEPLIGKKRILVLYIIGGLCGGIAALSWNYYCNVAGAAPAIFALYGFLLVLVIMKIVVLDYNAKLLYFVLASISLVCAFYIHYTLYADNSANIGGLLTGLFIGAVSCEAVRKSLDKKAEK
ncbi:rhomboid family intramembrane serine protease [Flavobacterium sp.]|uniref:rhomboid family intramembrane serine protease n=1 Tax=Flavobacterium sp. TaxID=239 RepID=UPI002FDDBCF0